MYYTIQYNWFALFIADSGKAGGPEKPHQPKQETRLLAPPGVCESKSAESSPAQGIPLVSYECTSQEDCTVTVTCSRVNRFSIEPSNDNKDKTVVSMNVKM